MVAELVVTPAVEAWVGHESEPKFAVDEMCRSELRRYVIATMDENRLWYDKAYAEKTRYGAGCAPASIVLRAVGGYRRDMGTPDGLRDLGVDDDWSTTDAAEDSERIPWPQGVVVFHGGDEVEYLQLPKIGDMISKVSKFAKLGEKTGRSGRVAA